MIDDLQQYPATWPIYDRHSFLETCSGECWCPGGALAVAAAASVRFVNISLPFLYVWHI